MSSPTKFSSCLAESQFVAARRVPAWVWLAGPYLIVLLALVALPLGNVVFLSFFKHSTTAIFTSEPTLSNYVRLVDGYYLNLLGRSLWIGAVTTLVCIVVGYPLAYYRSEEHTSELQ